MADATLSLAPTRAVAQAHALARLAAWPDARLLLPDVESRRPLLAAGVARTRLGTFYELARDLLRERGGAPDELSPIMARRLLHRLLDEMEGDGVLSESWCAVREKPGFIDTLRAWLREMKAQGIAPLDVLRAARATTSLRDDQLAELYDRYQNFLRENDLMDEEGLLWLSAEALERGEIAAQPPLIVLQFDQLFPTQQRLLAAWRAPVAFYLLWDETRTADSLVLTRQRATRAALAARFGPRLVAERLPAAPLGAPAPLAHLYANWFESHPPAPPDPAGALALVAAPSREGEVRHALREAKRLLLAGVPADAIALLAPNPTAYAGLVALVASEYGVPVAAARPLRRNPAIAALATLLTLAPDFAWRPTIELLRSPYLRQPWLSPAQVDDLERLTRERPVVSGRAAWWAALDPINPAAFRDEYDERRAPLAARLTPDALAAIRAGLEAFFTLATPPRSATAAQYARWLQQRVLGLGVGAEAPSFHLAAAALQGVHGARDRAALAALLDGLEALVGAARRVPPDGPQPWASFRAALDAYIDGPWAGAAPEAPAVRLAPIEEGRTLSAAHLFVLGLSEGEFPRPPRADPLYAPLERLAAEGLPLQRTEPGEEASIWWQLLGGVRERLTLLRPRLDAKGQAWEPSAYWDETLRLMPPLAGMIHEPAIGAPPPPDEAACEREFLLAVAAAGGAPPPPFTSRWARAADGARLQAWRADPTAPAGAFEGRIEAAELRAMLDQRFGPSHRWSASRLGSYASCGYGFFAREVLKLEPLPEPSEGLNVMQRGSLLHAALEELFKALDAAGLTLCAADEGAILALLDRELETLMARAPTRFGFRPDPLWERERAELERLLRRVVRHFCATPSPFRPVAVERSFGEDQELWIDGADGRRLRLGGLIDRVDEDGEGRLRIIDYKSGSTPYDAKEIEEGRALQTALYPLAAEKLFGKPVAESLYFHLPKLATSGRIEALGSLAENELVRRALQSALDNADAIRAGRFPAAPTKLTGCRESCEFIGICRVSQATMRKAKREEEDS